MYYTVLHKRENNMSLSVITSFRTTPEKKEKIKHLAEKTKRSESYYYNLMIDEYLEELEDLAEAIEIDAAVEAGTMKTYSLEEVSKELGL